jgi:hypothetical protein
MNVPDKLKDWLQEGRNRVLLIAITLMVVIVVTVEWLQPKGPESAAEASPDTYIPEGYVLVPIEIQNSESLSSLIGSFAIVDLFQAPGSHRVGKRLKLLRAPLNPQQFAVLVSESHVAELLNHQGPFWAAIQNPQQSQSSEQVTLPTKSRIEYFRGGTE